MHESIPNTHSCASCEDGEAGQSLCLVGQQTVRRARQIRAIGNAAATHSGNEKVSAAVYAWYALTVPFRLFLVFVCALVLIGGICALSVFGGDR